MMKRSEKRKMVVTGFEPQLYHLFWDRVGFVCKGTAFTLWMISCWL